MRTNVSKTYRALSVISAKSLDLLVDLIGIEPMTSSMPFGFTSVESMAYRAIYLEDRNGT